jgi:hypothetical protein
MLRLQLGVELKWNLGTKAATWVATIDDFYYKAEYKVLICKKHKQAVKGLERHLKDAHRLRKRKERRLLVDHYAELTLANPKDVATPSTNGPPFKSLGDPDLAYQCSRCSHISTSRKAIRGHYNKEHQ